MQTLGDMLAAFVPGEASHALETPPNWMQGRTLLGGVTAALLVHAARRSFTDLPPLRSAQFNFVGPATDRLTFTPELLRRGRNSAALSVDCSNGNGVAARALLTFSAARDSRVRHDEVPAPKVPAPEACEYFRPPAFKRPSGFPDNFELRKVGGARPLEGGTPEIFVWSRLVDDTDVDAELLMLMLGDGIPPAAMVQYPERRPVSTMTWTVDYFQPVEARGWHLLRSLSEQAADGYSLQGTDIWDARGRRVATARQVVALFA